MNIILSTIDSIDVEMNNSSTSVTEGTFSDITTSDTAQLVSNEEDASTCNVAQLNKSVSSHVS